MSWCFCLLLFLCLVTAAYFQSLPLWFCLLSRWRREAVRLLTKPRNTQARRGDVKASRPKSFRAGCSVTWKELTVGLSFRKRRVSDDPRQENHRTRHRVTDCICKVSAGIFDVTDKKKSNMLRRHLDATSSMIPMPRFRETDCSSKEEDDMIKLIPNLVKRIEENLKKTILKMEFDEFPSQYLQRDVFSHGIACGHHSKWAAQSRLASEVVRIIPAQPRRTCWTSWPEVFVNMSTTKNQLLCVTMNNFQTKKVWLTVNGQNHLPPRGADWRACALQKVHVFAQSSAKFWGSRRQPQFHDIWWTKAKSSHEAWHCNDGADQSVDIEWHVCPGNTSEQILHEATQKSCRRTGTNPRVFQTGSSSRARSTTLPTAEVKRCKWSVWTAQKKWSLMQQDSNLVLGVSLVQDRNRDGNTMSQGQLFIQQTGDGTHSLPWW